MFLASLPTDSHPYPLAWLALFLAVAAVVAVGLGALVGVVIRSAGRQWPVLVESVRRGRTPLRLVLVLVALQWVISSTTAIGGWQSPLQYVFRLTIVAGCGWLLAVVAFVAQDLTLAKFPIDVVDNRRARRVRTQVMLLRRVAVALIVTLVVASMLLTLPGARQAGAAILASAGVIGIVAGLAAQSSLSNLFAGLQLAFTNALRMEDVVVVEGEWGRIEEITLTYVVIRIWDDRRLILPSTYFTTTPFQNWTRKDSAILGTVELDLDWRVPLSELRTELDRTLAASTLWDGRTGLLQVTDATGRLVRIRVLVSGVDGPTVFDLRCQVREALVEYLRRHHPEALPLVRIATEESGEPGGADPGSYSARPGVFTGSADAEQRALEFTGSDRAAQQTGDFARG